MRLSLPRFTTSEDQECRKTTNNELLLRYLNIENSLNFEDGVYWTFIHLKPRFGRWTFKIIFFHLAIILVIRNICKLGTLVMLMMEYTI